MPDYTVPESPADPEAAAKSLESLRSYVPKEGSFGKFLADKAAAVAAPVPAAIPERTGRPHYNNPESSRSLATSTARQKGPDRPTKHTRPGLSGRIRASPRAGRRARRRG